MCIHWLFWPLTHMAKFQGVVGKNSFPHLLHPSFDCQCLNPNWYNPIQELKAIGFGLLRLVTES